MQEITVQSWLELIDRLYDDSWQPEINRFRSPYVYRGMGSADNTLSTSLMRLGGDYCSMENHLLRNFRKYAHRDIVEQDTFWHWLSLAQHHGLPTRLLDWTISPLVAAHFATVNVDVYDQDGAIWMVNSRAVHQRLPKLLREELRREGADYLTTDMLARAVPTMEDLNRLSSAPFVAFFEPPSIDERITNQFALFSVMPSPSARVDEWLQEHPELWRRIIIPAKIKWEVRDKLDQSNITERVLFPGLDGLSQWQKRYYTPRTKNS